MRFRLWLRYELFRGRLGVSEHEAGERQLAEFIITRCNSKSRRREIGSEREADGTGTSNENQRLFHVRKTIMETGATSSMSREVGRRSRLQADSA